MVNNGGYDMGGVWRPDHGSAPTYHFDQPSPYNQSLYSSYYTLEDDYYGAYGDLLEYEAQLRFSRDVSEEERMRRWRERLAFEELDHAERSRRYARMSERELHRLGLSGRSWWAGRYGRASHGHHHGCWQERFGDRLAGWTADRLPLSSTLYSRFGSVTGAHGLARSRVEEDLLRNERQLDNALYRQQARLSASMNDQGGYLREVDDDMLGRRPEDDCLERRLEENILERRLEEDSLERRLEEDSLERRFGEGRLERRIEENGLERMLNGEQDRIDRELRLEQQLNRDRLGDTVFEGRLCRDERALESEALYRESELDSYERERGFERTMDYQRDALY